MKLMKQIIYPMLSVALITGILSGYGITKPKAQSTSSAQSTKLLSSTKTAPDYNRVVDVSSKEARMAVLSEDTLEMAIQLPDAAWNSLPKWNGVTVSNMQEYGFECDGQPQVFIREDMENISKLGFNFVRVPLDTRLFFDLDDPSKVHLEKLVNLDELVSWGAEFGTHICIDVHFSFGFTTDEDNSNDTLWENPEEQELFLTFWDMLAERYKKVPSNLLSFNLMNEPNQGLDEEVYADLMAKITAGKTTKGKVQVVGLSAAGKKKASVSVGTSIKHKTNSQNATYTISSVAVRAFKDATKLKTVTLSKNIKYIKKDTFKNCKNLATVNCKAKLSSVAKDSFKGCTKTITVKSTSKAANKKLLQKKNTSVKFK